MTFLATWKGDLAQRSPKKAYSLGHSACLSQSLGGLGLTHLKGLGEVIHRWGEVEGI